MKIAIVITIYKDLEALKLIIESIKKQTVLPDEIIIAEDNNSELIANYVNTLTIENILIHHTSQPDNGWQRNKSSNNALRVCTSDYIIWIDGDCLPHSRLIESHKELAKENTVLCGRRVYIGEKYTKLLRDNEITLDKIESKYFLNIFDLLKDCRHYEEGIYIKPNSFLYKLLRLYLKKDTWIIGCHWSCWKKDMEKINGFDEDFTMPLYGEDVDVQRHLRDVGVNVKSCRNSAIVYHLHHEKIFDGLDYGSPYYLMKSKENEIICKNGLNKL